MIGLRHVIAGSLLGSFLVLGASQAAVAQSGGQPGGSVVVGQIRDYRSSDQGVIESYVLMGARAGTAQNYPDPKAAKAAAAALPGVEAVVQVKLPGGATVYELRQVRLINNTPENADRLAKGALAALTEAPLGKIEYRALRCSPDYSLVLDRRSDQAIAVSDIIDGRGLTVTDDGAREAGLKGSKFLRKTIDRELVRGNYLEAKEVYLFIADINAKGDSYDLDVVKIARKTNLAKLYHSGDAGLRAFVEAEMIAWSYTDADKLAVRGN